MFNFYICSLQIRSVNFTNSINDKQCTTLLLLIKVIDRVVSQKEPGNQVLGHCLLIKTSAASLSPCATTALRRLFIQLYTFFHRIHLRRSCSSSAGTTRGFSKSRHIPASRHLVRGGRPPAGLRRPPVAEGPPCPPRLLTLFRTQLPPQCIFWEYSQFPSFNGCQPFCDCCL